MATKKKRRKVPMSEMTSAVAPALEASVPITPATRARQRFEALFGFALVAIAIGALWTWHGRLEEERLQKEAAVAEEARRVEAAAAERARAAREQAEAEQAAKVRAEEEAAAAYQAQQRERERVFRDQLARAAGAPQPGAESPSYAQPYPQQPGGWDGAGSRHRDPDMTKSVHVREHTTKNGTVVHEHTRSAPGHGHGRRH